MRFDDIFIWTPIRGNTINGYIDISLFFICAIYVIAILVFVATAWYLHNTYNAEFPIKRAVIVSFFVTGVLYAAESEWVWQRWVVEETNKYFGTKTSLSPGTGEEILQNVAIQIKQLLSGSDYNLYSDYGNDDDVQYVAKKLQYYLLPSRNKPKSRFIIVVFDDNVRFDLSKKIFTDKDNNSIPAEMCLMVEKGMYILRVLP